MGTTLTAEFHTREEAETVVERLVQEHHIERTDISIAASGDENTAGDELSGADTEAGSPTSDERDDAPLEGTITISVDVNDADKIEAVRQTFLDFEAR